MSLDKPDIRLPPQDRITEDEMSYLIEAVESGKLDSIDEKARHKLDMISAANKISKELGEVNADLEENLSQGIETLNQEITIVTFIIERGYPITEYNINRFGEIDHVISNYLAPNNPLVAASISIVANSINRLFLYSKIFCYDKYKPLQGLENFEYMLDWFYITYKRMNEVNKNIIESEEYHRKHNAWQDKIFGQEIFKNMEIDFRQLAVVGGNNGNVKPARGLAYLNYDHLI